ncbi:MAG: AAA family ATPase, partial [Actinobacteria bacterium]|nr:AAA family ATPase [Actinomycetota bacterium]
MELSQLFYRYNPWWEDIDETSKFKSRHSILRQIESHAESPSVVFITGLRRVGKTTLMKMLIHQFIKTKKYQPRHIFYISLDDYQILHHSISELVEEFRKIMRLKVDQFIVLFFDEVSYRKNYELELKNLIDSQNVKIFASSSSASFVRAGKPYLTGRNVVVEVLPLDFQEFCSFKNIKISKRDSHLQDEYFTDFMKTGGMPEYVLRGEQFYLQELVDDIIMKDIVVTHHVRDAQLLKDFFLLLMERAGKRVSINKLAKIFHITPDTANRYLDMFRETFLIHSIQRHGKTTERVLSPNKLYAADLGIRVHFTGFRDIGSLFENYVFLKIKSMQPMYVYSN